MELTHLRYFVHVATARSFVRGAAAAAVTPPAISKAVRALEEELGVRLLERTTREVRLTRAGEVVLDRCERVLEQVESLRREAATVAGVIEGELRIGAMEVFSIELLPTAVARLVTAHPRVVPMIYELIPGDLVQALERGRLDVGFSIGDITGPGVVREVLGESPACVVCGPEHPRFERGSLRDGDLSTLPWVVPRFLGRALLPALDQFPDEHIPRKVGATIELLQAGIALACNGGYLGCFPEISIRRELAERRLRVLRGAPPIAAFGLGVFHRRRTAPSPAVAALVSIMRQILLERPRRPGQRRPRAVS